MDLVESKCDMDETDLTDAFRVLGVRTGASLTEVMEAHRDLVTVWDPKRLPDNPRLQRRAAEELRRINTAFEALRRRYLGDEAHTDGSQGQRTPTAGRPSLYEESLSKRSSLAAPRYVLVSAALLLLVILLGFWRLTGPEQDDSPKTSADLSTGPDIAQQETSLIAQQGTSPDRVSAAEETPKPELERVETVDPVSSSKSPSPVSQAAPIRRAFEILQRNSPIVSQLIERGSFEDLKYVDWVAKRAQLPEIVIDVTAEHLLDQSPVQLSWAVNLQTETIRPMNEATLDRVSRSSGPKPRLIREP